MANEFAINNKSPCVVICPTRDTFFSATAKAADLAGYSDGTFSGMSGTAWVSDTGAGGTSAIAFDGVNDGIGLPFSIPFAAGWSVSIWFKFSALSGLTFAFASSNSGAMRCYLAQNSGTAYIRVGDDASFLGGSTNLVTNQWHNLVVAIADSGTSYSGWVDGTSVGSRSMSLTTNGACGIGAFFGAVNSPSSNFASGRFDDLRIWNRSPLDSSDAASIWASGAGRGKLTSSGAGRPSHPTRQQVTG